MLTVIKRILKMSEILLSLWTLLKRKTSKNYSTYSKKIAIIQFRREFSQISWRDWDFDPVSKSIFDFYYISLFNHVVIITELDPKTSAQIGNSADAIPSKIVTILESNYNSNGKSNFSTVSVNGQEFVPIVVYLTLNEGSNSNPPGPLFPILSRILFNRQRQGLIQTMRPNGRPDRRPALAFVPILFRMALSKANQSITSNDGSIGSIIISTISDIGETKNSTLTSAILNDTGYPITNSSTPIQFDTQSDPISLFAKLILATISSKLHQLTCAWWVCYEIKFFVLFNFAGESTIYSDGAIVIGDLTRQRRPIIFDTSNRGKCQQLNNYYWVYRCKQFFSLKLSRKMQTFHTSKVKIKANSL